MLLEGTVKQTQNQAIITFKSNALYSITGRNNHKLKESSKQSTEKSCWVQKHFK